MVSSEYLEILRNVAGKTIGPKATMEVGGNQNAWRFFGLWQSGMKITEMGESLENINPAKF